MKKFLFKVGLPISICLGVLCASIPVSATLNDFDPGNIMDDMVATNYGSMNTQQIQAFLNSKVPQCDTNGSRPARDFGRPNMTRAQYAASRGWHGPPYTCLRDYRTENGRSAAQLIFDVAQKYHVNPQLLIVLLQKEQALVTDVWPTRGQFKSATGYGCPDSTVCDSKYFGLENQLEWAAKHFHYIITRSPDWYSPYTTGVNFVRWSPNAACGGSHVNIQNWTTAALYSYTPYQPNAAAMAAGYGTGDGCSAYGNRNFYNYFTDWFGNTRSSGSFSCRDGQNLANVETGARITPTRINGDNDTLTITVPNNTGSKCAEMHTWANSSLQSWSQHIATNSYTFNQQYSKVISQKVNHKNTVLTKVDYNGTASGRVEFHTWTQDGLRWLAHTATTAGPIDPLLSEVITADTNGDGADEYYLVNYEQTNSGMIEIHGWSNNGTSWFRHTATSHPSASMNSGRVIAADLDGDKKDEFIYVKYGNTTSKLIEFHVWDSSLKNWVRHTASNYPESGYIVGSNDIIAADLYGRGRDTIYYVKYRGTTNNTIEVHGWNDNQQSWASHISTSSGTY